MLTYEMQRRQEWLNEFKNEFVWWNNLSEFEQLYLRARACDIAHFGTAVADKTWPQPTLAWQRSSVVSLLVSWLVKLQNDVVKEIRENGIQVKNPYLFEEHSNRNFIPRSYLFRWNDIPGNDEGRLKEFLKVELGISWAQDAAKIEKIDDGKTIKLYEHLYSELNYLSLKLNEKKSEVTLESNDGKTNKLIAMTENGKINIYPMLDDLAPRVLNENEREKAKKACLDELLQSGEGKWNASGMLAVIKEFVHFCELLRQPENLIKKPSGQYVEKEVPLRTEADMVGEMSRELTNLPNYTAYAKITQTEYGNQRVAKIKTLELPEKWSDNMVNKIIKQNILDQTYQNYCQKREIIEREIRERQIAWQKELSEKPIPGREGDIKPEKPVKNEEASPPLPTRQH